jgi:hypothetical protein
MKLSQLIDYVRDGNVVLPDFQRSFIWEPEDVRELLVSVLGDYFIGSMLVLEQYKEDSPFKLRLVEGVQEVEPTTKMQSIVKVVLDGQQRTTALFYAFFQPNLPLQNRKSAYKFYVDVAKALQGSWDDAVLGVNVNDKKGMSEVRQNGSVIPFSELRDIGRLVERFTGHAQMNEIVRLANKVMNYDLTLIDLPRNTDLEKIVETFERINRTGEPLSVFELLTARLYKYDIRLRDLLDDAIARFNVANQIEAQLALKVIALARGLEPKRKSVLELDPKNFQADWERAWAALQTAFTRAVDIKNGYGVFDFNKWMPYSTMLVPLAAMLDHLHQNGLETKENYDKIDKWYWVSVFSNRYDQAADTTAASDLQLLRGWIDDNTKVPEFVQKFVPTVVELDTDKQSSATYRGIINLIVLQGALDFKTGQPPQFDKEKVQDDHIFPKSIYKENRISNRTLISTNQAKSNEKPSDYFKKRLAEHKESEMKLILKSHIIPEEALNELLSDDLVGFLARRKQALVDHLTDKLGLPKVVLA